VTALIPLGSCSNETLREELDAIADETGSGADKSAEGAEATGPRPVGSSTSVSVPSPWVPGRPYGP